jgi:CheY-like chemotaxis protein
VERFLANTQVSAAKGKKYTMTDKPLIFIDDDSEELLLMKEMAMAIYFPSTVLAFDKPERAIDYLQKMQVAPLFILSDVSMPKIDGWELRARIKDINPVIRDTPFIFLSSSRTVEEIRRADKLNVWGYYQKQSSPAGMKQVLHSIMDSLANTGE